MPPFADPSGYGVGDLDPLRAGRGGMVFDPLRMGGGRHRLPRPDAGIPGRIPPYVAYACVIWNELFIICVLDQKTLLSDLFSRF